MKIDHIALYCVDLDSMRDFFVSHFNARSNEMYHNPRTGLRTYFLSFTGSCTRLEIMSRPGITESRENGRTGYAHLSFSLGSRGEVDRLTRQLADNGYVTLDGPRVTGDGYYESLVSGPEGIFLELTE